MKLIGDCVNCRKHLFFHCLIIFAVWFKMNLVGKVVALAIALWLLMSAFKAPALQNVRKEFGL